MLLLYILVLFLLILNLIFCTLWYIYYYKIANYKSDKDRYLNNWEKNLLIKEKYLNSKEDCCNKFVLCKKVVNDIKNKILNYN